MVRSGCDEHVSEFTADPGGDTASAGSEQVLITIPHPTQSNHNGGQLQFGPDGDLYISVGDGGGGERHRAERPADLNRLLGKILRISPQATGYSIPAGNPFSGRGGVLERTEQRSELPGDLGLRLRNPWRFSFDSATGDMVIADVGQSAEEEIDFAHPGQNVGANYGWPCYEGLESRLGRAGVGVHPASLAGRLPGADLSAPAELRRRSVLRRRDHRRLRDARSDAAVARRLLRVRRPRHPRAARRAPRPAVGAPPRSRLGRRSPASRASDSTRAATSTPRTSPTATCTGSSRTATPPPTRGARHRHRPASPPEVTVQSVPLNPPGAVTLPAPRLTALRITRAGR